MLDGFNDVFLELRLGGFVAGFTGAEEGAGQDRAGPGAEVLGGEVGVGWGDGVEVGVDVGGGDGVGVAVVIEVVEELVAGGVVAGFDDAGRRRSVRLMVWTTPDLPLKLKVSLAPSMVTWRRRRVVRP